jgi:hypothetical protein
VFSLGVVLYEAAAGVRPFGGDGVLAVAESVVAGSYRSLAEHRPDLSAELVAAIERALETDPADRHAGADEMLAALATPSVGAAERTVPQSPPTATATLPPPVRPTPGSPPPAADRGPRVVRRAVGACVVVLVLAIAGVVALLGAGGDDRTTPPASAAPVTVASTVAAPGAGPPVPEPLARALDALDAATRP